jgi:hypothetical protein
MTDTANELYTRYLEVHLILNTGSFKGGQVKIIKDLTMDITLSKQSGFMNSTADITIFGMSIDDINAFTRINTVPIMNYQNTVEVYAGYSLNSLRIPSLVYRGQVKSAMPDFNDPSRPFKINSQVGVFAQNQISSPINIKGGVPLQQLFANIATAFNLNAPKGVSGNANNPIYTGSAVHQLNSLAKDYGLKAKIDDKDLLVAGSGKFYRDEIIEISVDNNLLGYPVGEEFGISCRVRFNPLIRFGQKVKLKSYAKWATGEWYINGLTTTLQNRGAKWESQLMLNAYAYNLGGA